MTRWVGFVLGAALALAAVHRLGVCDLAVLRDQALAVGRTVLDGAPEPREARTGPEGDAGEPPGSDGGVAGARSAGTKPQAGPGPLAALRPRSPNEDERLVEPQPGASLGGTPPGPGGRDSADESAADDAPAPGSLPGPDTAVTDAGQPIASPEGGRGLPPAGSGQVAPGGEAAMTGGEAASAAASIWVPFRSRRSAEGFAEHLHQRFGLDLEVRRAGPGDYGVYLTAASEDALADGLDRLRSAGALPGPEERR